MPNFPFLYATQFTEKRKTKNAFVFAVLQIWVFMGCREMNVLF